MRFDPYVFDAGRGSQPVPFIRSWLWSEDAARSLRVTAGSVEVRVDRDAGRAYGLSWWQFWSLEVGQRVADAWAYPDEDLGWHFAGDGKGECCE